MRFRANYTTDINTIIALVSLTIDDVSFAPSNLLLEDARLGVCLPPEGFTPRHALIATTSGDQLKIEYPFRPDTPDWYQFWQELYANPLIASSVGVGEIIKGQSLRYALGV